MHFFTFLKCLFSFERQCKRGGGAEREGQRIPSRLHTDNIESDVGLKLPNREITTQAEVGHLTN